VQGEFRFWGAKNSPARRMLTVTLTNDLDGTPTPYRGETAFAREEELGAQHGLSFRPLDRLGSVIVDASLAATDKMQSGWGGGVVGRVRYRHLQSSAHDSRTLSTCTAWPLRFSGIRWISQCRALVPWLLPEQAENLSP
jgi:hypothetical protein